MRLKFIAEIGEGKSGVFVMNRNMKSGCFVRIALAAAASVTTPTIVYAQSPTFTYNMPARSLESALRAFARTSRQQLIFDRSLVRTLHSPALTGTYTAEQAIGILLSGTGLSATRNSRGVWVIQQTIRSDQALANEKQREKNATVPEILVIGRRDWSLNTGIARTKDDSQPFTVFSRDDIKKSGAVDVETFLRNELSSNASASTAEQAGGGDNLALNRSSINLRGLSSRDTLVLVDGRRQAGISTGEGDLDQASITGIPLASIERIEVLASSASGLYGLGATGGVVNIILRRDYTGGQISETYSDTGDFKAPELKIDGSYAFNLEGGRTNVSFSGSYRKTKPLLNEDRNFIKNARDLAFRLDPSYFDGNPPLSSSPNISSVDLFTDRFANVPLTLKPQYGGTALGSVFTSVPSGYRGIALDGVAPLIANAGKYNLALSDTADAGGGRSPLIVGAEQYSGSLAIRREMNNWLRLYVEAAASKSTTTAPYSRAQTSSVILSPDSTANPFQQTIEVTFPTPGADGESRSTAETRRVLGGAILKLPHEWQGGIDLSWSSSKYSGVDFPPGLSQDSYNRLYGVNALTGAPVANPFTVIADTVKYPLPFDFVQSIYGTYRTPALTTILDATAKLAGPIPIHLPAGRPSVSLNFERSNNIIHETRIVINQTFQGNVYDTPRSSQTITSLYAETRIPIISEAMAIPFIRAFEFNVAARYERYSGRGSSTATACLSSRGTSLTDDQINGLVCPPAGTTVNYATTSNGHADPSVSLKWTVNSDLILRASYSKGYLPPRLSNLIKVASRVIVGGRDPDRGGALIGTPFIGQFGIVPGFSGGNPDVKPETSQTFSVGAILTPRFLDGFRFSADWTHIKKKNNYFNPLGLIQAQDPVTGQAAFVQFLRLFPERFTRGPASGGFAVGPITSIDASSINLTGSEAEAVDFTANYTKTLWGGSLQGSANATWVLKTRSQILPSLPIQDYTGVADTNFTGSGPDLGSLRWKGSGTISWTGPRFGLGVTGRYFDSYFLNIDRAVVTSQGSAKIPSQAYFDVFGSYGFTKGLSLRAGINDVFNKSPPIVTTSQVLYSAYGDPRLRNFYLQLKQSF